MPYCYVKAKSRPPLIRPKLALILSLVFFGGGALLLAQVIYPIIAWSFFALPGFDSELVSPLASSYFEKQPSLPDKIASRLSIAPAHASPNVSKDSYNLSNWVGSPPSKSDTTAPVRYYNLSIPKLKIDGATVEIGGSDLKKNLVAWSTSALPGNYGNTTIFGHSELPQFANPKDYSGVFTFIMDLKQDDPIYVDYDGVRYKYLVTDQKVVKPTDLSVLDQKYDASYIRLVTCVPPGTLWMRGIVTGKLTKI